MQQNQVKKLCTIPFLLKCTILFEVTLVPLQRCVYIVQIQGWNGLLTCFSKMRLIANFNKSNYAHVGLHTDNKRDQSRKRGHTKREKKLRKEKKVQAFKPFSLYVIGNAPIEQQWTVIDDIISRAKFQAPCMQLQKNAPTHFSISGER